MSAMTTLDVQPAKPPCSWCHDTYLIVVNGVEEVCPCLPVEPMPEGLFDRIMKATRPEMDRIRAEHEVAEQRRASDNAARIAREKRSQARIGVGMVVVGFLVALSIVVGVAQWVMS